MLSSEQFSLFDFDGLNLDGKNFLGRKKYDAETTQFVQKNQLLCTSYCPTCQGFAGVMFWVEIGDAFYI